MQVHQAGKHSVAFGPSSQLHTRKEAAWHRQRPLVGIGQRQGGSDRSAPRDSAQHPGGSWDEDGRSGEFPVGPIARTLLRFHSGTWV